MTLVSARVVAASCGVSQPRTVLAWAVKGVVPSVPYGKQVRFDLADVQAALRERAARPSPTTKACSACGRDLPLGQFRTKKNGGDTAGKASDCNDCHKAYNEGRRRAEAAARGRAYQTRREAARERAALRTERKERYEKYLAEQAAARRAKDEMLGAPRITCTRCGREKLRGCFRSSELDWGRAVCAVCARKEARERYARNPKHHARVKAKKVRRKRALAAAHVEPVVYEVVVERDGWRCGICGGKVTRKNWSLDHIVPLSQGGEHSYRNTVLAHRKCNSARGVGRKPVQPSLLPAPPATTMPPHTFGSCLPRGP